MCDEMQLEQWPPVQEWFPDTSKPPPAIPRAVGTSLYPASDIRYRSDMPIAMQVRLESLNRQRNEKWRIVDNKGRHFEDFREANQHIRANYCAVCSEFEDSEHSMRRTNHKHFSSLEWRIQQRCDAYGQFYCIGCQRPHSVKSGSRIPLLLTSSMLANWRGNVDTNGYRGDDIHLDSISIPGSRISDLNRAFLAEYKGAHRPVDVLVCAGLNDVAAGHTVDLILDDARKLRNSVLTIPGSSCLFSTLPYPPKLTMLYDLNRNLRRDYLPIISDVNLGFDTINSEISQPADPGRAPKFHTFGTKATKSPSEHPRNWMAYTPKHKDSAWRERKPSTQLHLSDNMRLKMGKSVIKYFLGKYSILPNRLNKWKLD